MREVMISDTVAGKIGELENFLKRELKFSKTAAKKRSQRLRQFVKSLCNPGDFARCRVERWRSAGYRCAVFEGWVFAYQIFDDGVIVRDMSHGALLKE